MTQSGRAVPGGVTPWRRGKTLPSRLVVVPSTSATPAAANNTAAVALDGFGKVSTAITVARSSALDTSGRSAKSASGSAPSRISTRREPSAAAASMAAVSNPRVAGNCTGPASLAHPSLNHCRPASSSTRPGNRPGVKPMSRAPMMLPRVSAGRKRAPASASRWAASTSTAGSSLSEVRPRTTVNGWPAGTSSTARRARASREPPGWPCRRWVA